MTRSSNRGRLRTSDVLLALSAVSVVMAIVLGLAGPAAATWSIVAVDEDSGEVGAAMASCAAAAALGDADEVLAPIVLVPGRGAGVLQGTVRPSAIEEMAELLTRADITAPLVIEMLLAAEEDGALASVRQYGVVLIGDDSESPGVHVGEDTGPEAVAIGATGVTVQTVRTESALQGERTLSAYLIAREAGLSLSDSLVAGLEAGAVAGGDLGCGSQRALFAQLAVAHPADDDGRSPSTLLTVTVDDGDGQDPVELLAEAYRRDDRGWINAGLRSPTLMPRWIVFAVGMAMALASLLIIRKGMRMG